MNTIFAWLRTTQVILFLILFCFSMLLLTAVSFLYKVNMGDIFAKFHNQNLQTVSHALLDDMRDHAIAHGPLTSEQVDWMIRRATIYGILLQYRETASGNGAIWVDTIARNKQDSLSHVETSPYVRDGKTVGYLTVAYSEYRDALNPIYVQYEALMEGRSRLLLAVIIVVSLIFSFVVARFMSGYMSRLSAMAHQIRLGERNASAPVRGPEEARRLALTLNEMSSELKKQEQWREHLMEDLAHELRTPLMSILTHIEAIIDGIYQPDEERMNSIYEELERLARLLSDLQQLSEAESAQFSLKLKKADMTALARRVYHNFLPIAVEKGIKLAFDSAKVPCHALVDRDKMIQIISNIVSNAIKYTPPGGWVKLEVIWTIDDTLICCTDNGVGIAEHDQPYVFNRLYRTDKSRSRFSGGVGLGLSIAKALAEAQNSRITLESQVGEGSKFTVVVPNE